MDKMREALERIYDNGCERLPASELRRIAYNALMEPPEDDALQTAKDWLDREVKHPENTAASLAKCLESFAVSRERKAREETARKCAEAAVAWHKLVYPGDAHALGDTLERAILEAAK